MKIYKLDFDVDNYRSVELCEEAEADYYQMFDGRSLKDNWRILRVKEYDEDQDLRVGDAPGFHIPLLNQKALELLRPLIQNDVEILPFQFGDELLYGLNVTTVLDAIDYSQSVYKTFRDGKRIMAFQKYSFKNSIVNNKNIFKIIDMPRGDVFVSESIFSIIVDSKLEGFELKLVYEG